MPIASLALGLFALAAAEPQPAPTLDRLVALVGEGKCDDAFLLLSQLAPAASPVEHQRAASRALARGAAGCRASDPVVALELSAFALRLAPEDPGVVLAHAEGLLALDQRGEAAELLERTMDKASPAEAPRIWLLRGQLAAREADHPMVAHALEPLATGEFRAQVEPLLAASRREARATRARARAMGEAEARANAAVEASRLRDASKRTIEVADSDADSEEEDGEPDSDAAAEEEEGEGEEDGEPDSDAAAEKEVGEAADDGSSPGPTPYPGSIGLRGSTFFVARGLTPGRSYRFHATGSCTSRTRLRDHGVRGSSEPGFRTGVHTARISGLDFRVQFGRQPSRSLPVGQRKEEESRISFVADAPTMTVRVFDESSIRSRESVSCKVGSFSVEPE